jgi:hypothetical protein
LAFNGFLSRLALSNLSQDFIFFVKTLADLISVDERTFKDSICISSSVMSLLPEPVLWLPHQLQILANLFLLILTLTVSFLAV